MAVTRSMRSGTLASGGNIWQNLAKAGSIQGEWQYYADDRAKPAEYQNLLSTALKSPDRRAVVDYLFDSGAAQGDRNYWYTARGDEDQDLAVTLGTAAATGVPAADRISQLRGERLESALAAIRAQGAYEAGDLQSQMKALGSLFNSSTADVQMRKELGVGDIRNSYADRGLGRSGLKLMDLAQFEGRMADEQASLVSRLNPVAGAEGTEIRSLMSALAMLDQQIAAAEAEAKMAKEQEELELAQLVALTRAGLA